jgi:hypothetical protein
VVVAYFNVVKQMMTEFFPRAVQVLSECSVSVARAQVWCTI